MSISAALCSGRIVSFSSRNVETEMELSTLRLAREPNGLPEEFVWLSFPEGDQTYLVRIARADVDGFAQQTLPRNEQDALVEKNRDTLAPLIEEKRTSGWLIHQPMANGVPIQAIPLTRMDLVPGMSRASRSLPVPHLTSLLVKSI